MSDVLVGTPDLITRWLKARYEPLRDSRAHAEPELQQRKFFKGTGNVLVGSAVLLEGGLLVFQHLSVAGVVFGLVVAGVGAKFFQLAKAPLKFEPPEPLENLVALSQCLGLCYELDKAFPTTNIELSPLDFTFSGSYDGYDWKVRVDREQLKPLPKGDADYQSYAVVEESSSGQSASGRVWQRAGRSTHRHRVFWNVEVEGDFSPKPGQPTPHTSLERHEKMLDKTICSFTLPINQPDQPGLGHDGRTDFISSPIGLHHPEFVGEQVAASLIWMFKPRSL